MLKSKILPLAALACSLLALSSGAQDTNIYPAVPPTILETLEAAPGQLVVKATMEIGNFQAAPAIISVACKEDTVPGTSRKEHGIMIGIRINGLPDDHTVIDYDELGSLIAALNYLAQVNWSVTSLSSFNAVFQTKAGLRVATLGSKRAGQIEFSIRSSRMAKGILLPPDQVTQLRSLLEEAKRKLDSLRNG